MPEARASIGRYIDHFYNARRPHSSLDRQTPDEAYFNALNSIGDRVTVRVGSKAVTYTLGGHIRRTAKAVYKYLDGQIEMPTMQQRPFVRAAMADALLTL